MTMQIKIPNIAVPVVAGTIGGGGLTLQAVMEGMSFALLAGNLVLVTIGIVFTCYKFWKSILNARKPPPGD